jgi:hypothetical protein
MADGKLDPTQPKELVNNFKGPLPHWLDYGLPTGPGHTWPYGRIATAGDGRQCVVAWTRYHFGGVTSVSLCNGDIMLARVDGWKGLEGVGVGLGIGATPENEMNPALASNGAGKLLCVYGKQPDDGKSKAAIAARLVTTY